MGSWARGVDEREVLRSMNPFFVVVEAGGE
jgi:hypothetical protein